MITAALAGNPNVGKTTLFNALTGSNQYVGNWAGVTVEKKEGFLSPDIKIVDLPGIYAMDTFSNEEKVSKQFLKEQNVDVILNIVDVSNLNRNLYLTTQLKQFGKPIILLMNMMDVAAARDIQYDFEVISKELGVKVLPISASKGQGLSEIKTMLEKSDFFCTPNENCFQLENEKDTYEFIGTVIERATINKGTSKRSKSELIDHIVLNKFLAYPIFLLILFGIFKLTFSWVGQPLADQVDTLLNGHFVPWLTNAMAGSSDWFRSLIIEGIVGGVGAVIVFVPVILALFLGISFLEDSGYMARAAFIMDRVMRRMGLSGKAFIPMVVGFGCSVPAIMSARTLESEKDRKLTALIVPLMSCNARLPVYALFASVFFKGNESLVVFSLYLLGIVMAFLIGLLFKNTLFRKEEEPFIIELPEYKMPELRNLLKHTWDKGKGFLKKAGTIIFAISVIVWFLSNYNLAGRTAMNTSLLAQIGKAISPVFGPLGFASWQNAVSLLTGLMAKEVVIGTMGVIYGGNLAGTLGQHFTALSSYSFMAFVLLYTPCVSVIATMKKEFGTRMMAFSIAYQMILAWIVAFLIYNIGKMIPGIG